MLSINIKSIDMKIYLDSNYPSPLYSDEEVIPICQQIVHNIQLNYEPEEVILGDSYKDIHIRQQVLLYSLIKELISRGIDIPIYIKIEGSYTKLSPSEAISFLPLIN
jgi:hypothetical protein